MRHLMRVAAAVIVCIAGQGSEAAVLDLSKPIICAPVEAFDCSTGKDCTKGLPDDVGAPDFMRIDLQKKVVIGPKRSTPIRFIDRSPDQTLLQGTELGFAWTLALDPQGKMTATLANRNGGYVLSGSCTTL